MHIDIPAISDVQRRAAIDEVIAQKTGTPRRAPLGGLGSIGQAIGQQADVSILSGADPMDRPLIAARNFLNGNKYHTKLLLGPHEGTMMAEITIYHDGSLPVHTNEAILLEMAKMKFKASVDAMLTALRVKDGFINVTVKLKKSDQEGG